MFAATDDRGPRPVASRFLATPERRIEVPVLAVTGEEDAPVMRKAAALENLSPLCASLEVSALEQCGHYPMEEMPPRTVALVERFCSSSAR